MADITFIVDTGCQFSGISGLIDSFTIANRWHTTNVSAPATPSFPAPMFMFDYATKPKEAYHVNRFKISILATTH